MGKWNTAESYIEYDVTVEYLGQNACVIADLTYWLIKYSWWRDVTNKKHRADNSCNDALGIDLA